MTTSTRMLIMADHDKANELRSLRIATKDEVHVAAYGENPTGYRYGLIICHPSKHEQAHKWRQECAANLLASNGRIMDL